MKNLSQGNWSLGQELNPGCPEYEAGLLTTRLRCLIVGLLSKESNESYYVVIFLCCFDLFVMLLLLLSWLSSSSSSTSLLSLVRVSVATPSPHSPPGD
jgi:hypothetical protein